MERIQTIECGLENFEVTIPGTPPSNRYLVLDNDPDEIHTLKNIQTGTLHLVQLTGTFDIGTVLIIPMLIPYVYVPSSVTIGQ